MAGIGMEQQIGWRWEGLVASVYQMEYSLIGVSESAWVKQVHINRHSAVNRYEKEQSLKADSCVLWDQSSNDHQGPRALMQRVCTGATFSHTLMPHSVQLPDCQPFQRSRSSTPIVDPPHAQCSYCYAATDTTYQFPSWTQLLWRTLHVASHFSWKLLLNSLRL